MYDGATPGHSPAHPSKIFSSPLRNTLTASWTAASAATGSDHQGDAVVALHVLCAASVAALGLGFSLPLRLAPIVVILARHCGQHVEPHAVEPEYSTGELVTVRRGHHPRRRQIEGECFAVNSCFSTSQSEAEKRDNRSTCSTSRISPVFASPISRHSSGARQLCARLVLDIPRNDLETALDRERLELVARAVGVLFVGGSSEIGTNIAHRTLQFSLDGSWFILNCQKRYS